MARGRGDLNALTIRPDPVRVIVASDLQEEIAQQRSKRFAFSYTKKQNLLIDPLGPRQREKLDGIIETGHKLLDHVNRAYGIYSTRLHQTKEDCQRLDQEKETRENALQTLLDRSKLDRDNAPLKARARAAKQAHGAWLKDEFWPAMDQVGIQEAAAWRLSIMHVLEQVREMGPSKDFKLPMQIDGDERIARLSQRAMRYLPRDWIDAFDIEKVLIKSPNAVSVSGAVGVYMTPGEENGHPTMPVIELVKHYLKPRGGFFGNSELSALGVIYHEWVHHTEAKNPLLYPLGLAYRQDREYKNPGALVPGDFSNPHMAHDYEDDRHTEIFSAGLSGWMFDDGWCHPTEIAQDKEYAAFLLGTMAII